MIMASPLYVIPCGSFTAVNKWPGAKTKAQSKFNISRTNRVNRIDLYEIIDTYRQRCKPGRKRFIDLVVRTLKEMKGNQLYIDEVNHQLIENYIAYLETPRPVSTGQGTIRSNAGVRYPQKYVGVIQAAFNLYKRDNLNFTANFPKIEMKKEVPPHKALTLEEVRKLYYYTPTKKNEQIAKDVFFLSFFLVGINLVDLFTLPPLKGGKVGYCRSKTREKLFCFFLIFL